MGYAMGFSEQQAVASFPDALVPQADKAVGVSFATYSSSQYPHRAQLLRCSPRGHSIGRVFLSAVACIAAVVLLISICSKTQLRGHSFDSRSRRLSSNDRTKRGFEKMCEGNAEDEAAWLQSDDDEDAGEKGPLHKKPRVSTEVSENTLSEQILEGSSGTGGGVAATSEHRAQVAPSKPLQHLPHSKRPASIAAMKWTSDELEATAALFQLRVGHEYAVRVGPVEGIPGTTLYIEPKGPPQVTSVQEGKQSKRRMVKLATFLKTSRSAGGAASRPAGGLASAPASGTALGPSGGPESGLASVRAGGTASGPLGGPSSEPEGGLATAAAARPIAGPPSGSSSELRALLSRVPEDQTSAVTATSSAVGTAEGTTRGPAPGTAQGTTHGTAPGTAQGTTHGTAPGTAQGTTHGTAPGTAQGTTHGTAPGTAQGTTPGTAPGTAQGTAHGTAPGITGGTAAGTETGVAAAAATGDGDNSLPGTSRAAGDAPVVEHLYFRLPKVEQTLEQRLGILHVRPDIASEMNVAPLSPVSLLRKAHNLLIKDCLTREELQDLIMTTELLVLHAMQYQRRSLPQDRPSRAVAMLGMRFLIFDIIVSTLNIIGQPARGPWWERLIASVPHSYREIVLPENARGDAKFNKMLISRLVASIAILKTGKRPFKGEVIELKMLLFFHEFSPSRFREEQFSFWKQDQEPPEK